MTYHPGAYSQSAVARAIIGNRQQFDTTVKQYDQIESWAGRGSALENTITIPQLSGITTSNLDGPNPNADNMIRKLTSFPSSSPPPSVAPPMAPPPPPAKAAFDPSSSKVIQSNTSNLVTCPNADGEVPLGCWLFSSENDVFARKNLSISTTPGTSDPPDIYVAPGNFMDMQNNGTGESSWAQVSDDLYNAEQLPSERRIFTGVMINSNTGETYETYEDDVPPPDTDKYRLLPEQMTIQNPVLTALSGGHDPSMPRRNKVEVPQNEADYGADAGRNIWGPQLYTTAVRDLAEQIDVRQQYNNRDGFVPVEPAWDRRAVGFVGHVSAYRMHPSIPATQREAYGSNYTLDQSTRNVCTGNMDLPVRLDADKHLSLSHRSKNRGSGISGSANGQGATLSDAHPAPGRVAFSAADTDGESMRNGGSRQLYSTGHARLREECPAAEYLQPQVANDLEAMQHEYGRICRTDPTESQRLQQAELFDELNQGRLMTARRALRKVESTGVGNIQQYNPTALSGFSDGPAQYLNDPVFLDSIRLVTDRTEKNAESVGIRHHNALENAMDGRKADEQAFMDSVRLVTDNTRRPDNVRIRNRDVLNANEQHGGQTAQRVRSEPVNSYRHQGLGGTLEQSGEVQKTYDNRASGHYDKTTQSQYKGAQTQHNQEGATMRSSAMDPAHDKSARPEAEYAERLQGGSYPSAAPTLQTDIYADTHSRGSRGNAEQSRQLLACQ
jgi:hypothetical protein